MLIVNRFRVPQEDAEEFRARLEAFHAILASATGYVGQGGRDGAAAARGQRAQRL